MTIDNADHLRDASPWRHEPDPIKLAVLGKTVEEMGELLQALGRAICQGVDQNHPVTGKANVEWIEEEKIDVENMFSFLSAVITLYQDQPRSGQRLVRKRMHIWQWLDSIRGK